MKITADTEHVPSESFLHEVKAVVHSVRKAFSDLLIDARAEPSEPQEMSRRFGLDKTLAWRVSRVVREDDPWEVVSFIPRRPSMQIFVAALSKANGSVSADRVAALWRAFDDFERFVEVHSGDRETLEVMASSAGKRTSLKRLETYRKSAFMANSATWGVRARVQLSMWVVAPDIAAPADAPQVIMSTVSGLIGFRRLRPDVPWSMATLRSYDSADHSVTISDSSVRPLDDSLERGAPPLLRQFCSDPLPVMRRIEYANSMVRFDLAEGPVGNTAPTHALLGWRWVKPSPLRAESPGEQGQYLATLSTPAETLLHDLILHKSLAFAMNPQAAVYSQLPGGPLYPNHHGSEAGRLPVDDNLVSLGSPATAVTPEIPEYDSIARYVTDSMGFDINDFRLFRLRLRYPPIPALAVIRHPLLP